MCTDTRRTDVHTKVCALTQGEPDVHTKVCALTQGQPDVHTKGWLDNIVGREQHGNRTWRSCVVSQQSVTSTTGPTCKSGDVIFNCVRRCRLFRNVHFLKSPCSRKIIISIVFYFSTARQPLGGLGRLIVPGFTITL